MTGFYLSLGSNLEPEKNIPACIDALKKQFPLIKLSSVYETDPVGPAGSEKFWNLAAAFKSDLPKEEIQSILRNLESRLGRKRSADKYAPRSIDIDLLPQPGYEKTAFIMIPLAEIAGDEKDSETGKTYAELASAFKKEKQAFKRMGT